MKDSLEGVALDDIATDGMILITRHTTIKILEEKCHKSFEIPKKHNESKEKSTKQIMRRDLEGTTSGRH